MEKNVRWIMVLLLCWPTVAIADDPLDEITGTEDWDQVVPAGQQAQEKTNLQEFRRQVDEWNAVRARWQQEREDYFQEKAAWGKVARPSGRRMMTEQSSPPPAASEDWGDEPRPSSLSSSIDRIIDDEMGANRPASTPTATPAPVQPMALPAPEIKETSVDQFSSFRGSQTGIPQDSGQLAPPGSGPARPATAVQPAVPAKPSTPEPQKTITDDEAAGAAAAAELLRRFEEERRREQEAIMKKAQLQEDEEGQVIDPEIKKEMEEE